MSENFEPEIIGFCCKYCAYAAADLAGSMRLSYPANIKIVQVPCTGRIDVIHLLNAVENGADGVMVAGCLEGECHFLSGNLRARRRVNYAKKLLGDIGMDSGRIEMFNLSSAMGARFAEIANEMTENVLKIGANPIKQIKEKDAA